MEENNQNDFPIRETEGFASENPASYPFQNQLAEEPSSEPLREPEKKAEKNDFSAKKWLWAGILIAVLNPLFAGLILGALFLTEPKLKKLGAAVMAISVVWGVISYFLLQKYWNVTFSGF